jgi:hypothetical protein
MISTVKSSNMWDIMVCNLMKVNRRFGGSKSKPSLLPASCWFIAWHILSTLKMETVYSFETSVDFHRTTRSYIQEDSHCCENLKANSEWHYNFRLDDKWDLYQNQVVVLVKQEAYYFIFGARGWSSRDTSWRSTRLSTMLLPRLHTVHY